MSSAFLLFRRLSMLFNLNPSLAGWTVVAVMLSSGFILGAISDRLLRLVGVKDRSEWR
jgi:hypothetical protein